jgi:hypothetical protein
MDDKIEPANSTAPTDQPHAVAPPLADDEFDPREMYPLIWKTAAEAGCDDPRMDIYDHYDDHRPERR